MNQSQSTQLPPTSSQLPLSTNIPNLPSLTNSVPLQPYLGTMNNSNPQGQLFPQNPQQPNLFQSTQPSIQSSSIQNQPQINIPNADQQVDRSSKQKHAMDFLLKVRDQYNKTPHVYNEFLEIMKGFKSGGY
jgi:paired amphipathic helix protein Sin3a